MEAAKARNADMVIVDNVFMPKVTMEELKKWAAKNNQEGARIKHCSFSMALRVKMR